MKYNWKPFFENVVKLKKIKEDWESCKDDCIAIFQVTLKGFN